MVHIVLQDNKRKRPPSSPKEPPKRHIPVDLLASESDEEEIEVIELPESAQRAPQVKEHSDLKKLKCPVCLDHPDEMVAAACGHVYCHDCIFQALASTRRASQVYGECSVCRQRVRYDQVNYLQMYEKPQPQCAPAT